MPRRRTVMEQEMERAEPRGRVHSARAPRSHLSHEMRELGQHEHMESINYKLMPHARMCAQGQVTRAFAAKAAARNMFYRGSQILR